MKRLHRLAASGCKHQVQAVAWLVFAVDYPIGTAVDPQKRNRCPLPAADEEAAAGPGNDLQSEFGHAAFVKGKAAIDVTGLETDVIEERHGMQYIAANYKEKRRHQSSILGNMSA